MFLQQTIREKVRVEGVGLHSGQKTEIAFCPAPPNTGIHFVRRDLPSCPSLSVRADNVRATALATTVGNEDFSVATIEHCLSSVAALRIDNMYIEMTGSEIPICDGSATVFFDRLRSSGVIEQGEPRQYLFVTQPVYVGDEAKHAYVVPYNGLRVGCTIDFPHPAIGLQKMDLDVDETTFSQVADARTFGFLKDVEAMRSRGLALGGSLDNAIVLDDGGIMNPGGLRYEDEFVRHKVLDAIGDLVTLGAPLMGHIVLYKAGHDLMNQLVKKILQSTESFRRIDLGQGLPELPEFKPPF